MRRTFTIMTLGCKVNQQESETLAVCFNRLGFEAAARGAAADVCVINSCAVTASADSKTRQRIRRARADNPDALICVIGCLPEMAQDLAAAMPEVDLAVGSLEKGRTAEFALAAIEARAGETKPSGCAESPSLRGAQRRGNPRMPGLQDVFMDCFASLAMTEAFPHSLPTSLPPSGVARTRAFLKAEDGCDRFCAYCVIPYARGPVRSRPMDDILREAEALLAAGYKELVVTGINLALYGQDIAAPAPSAISGRFAQDGLYELARRLCALAAGDEYRVRLGSLEPTVADARGAARLAALPGICPHFHLSLQSGAARTLEAMGRRYTPGAYEDIVRALRGIDPLFGLTTDVIVGFPGETDEDFAESLDFVKKIGFMRVHVFKYSKRPGTRAAGMGGQVSEDVKNARSRAMIEAAEAGAAHFLAENARQARRTLVYGPDKNRRFVRGLTDNGINLRLPAHKAGAYRPNEFAEIAIPENL
ncbi:MAG: radical SAM protein [Clostridiales Family XIII bacterium]|jgi:threonylcarbamoyladenosine tRNA methylthiotransferase MtaB|nr:radical SAM protein [Clostridiales Family XIII bacterium]